MKKRTENPEFSEEEESITNESKASDEVNDLDLDASSTESDDEDDVDSDEDNEEESEHEGAPAKTRGDIIEEKIHNKYQQLRGTRLYVRFPEKLPLDDKEFDIKVKALHPLVAKATKPRQKHARFCLVDFKSQADRDKALKEIKASIETDKAYKGIFVSVPKTDTDEFVNELVARQQQSLENRKTKIMIKRAKKQVKRKENFTSSVVITNLPKTTSVAHVRTLFDNAVDIQIKPGKGKFREFSAATVTLPTTQDARAAFKKELSLGGSKLQMRFNTQQQQKRQRNRKNLKRKTDGEGAQKKKKAKPTVAVNSK